MAELTPVLKIKAGKISQSVKKSKGKACPPHSCRTAGATASKHFARDADCANLQFAVPKCSQDVPINQFSDIEEASPVQATLRRPHGCKPIFFKKKRQQY
jgi:hypothetical protein